MKNRWTDKVKNKSYKDGERKGYNNIWTMCKTKFTALAKKMLFIGGCT